MKKALAILFFSFACSFNATAQLQPFQAGEYITEGGWGVLRIDPMLDGKQYFEIETANANGHSCTLSGDIIDRISTLSFEETTCQIIFYKDSSSIQVAVDSDFFTNCQMYCGARGHFTSLYRPPSEGCTTQEINSAISTFENLVELQNYEQALHTLNPILTNCQQTLSHYMDGRLRNQLAEIQAILHHKQDCLNTLKPWTELANKTDDLICNNPASHTYLPPIDCYTTLEIVHDIRRNLESCLALPD